MITDQTTDVLVLIGRRPVDVCQAVKRYEVSRSHSLGALEAEGHMFRLITGRGGGKGQRG